jgi:hypothetical protein
MMRMLCGAALSAHSVVMPRLGLGIHEFGAAGRKLVNPKAKPWDDERVGGFDTAPQATS